MKYLERKKNNVSSRWIDKPLNEITPSQELTFEAMRVRAVERAHYGPKTQTSLVHYFFFVALWILVLITEEDPYSPTHTDTDKAFIELSGWLFLQHVLNIVVFLLLLHIMSDNYKPLLLALFVYIPLIVVIFYQIFPVDMVVTHIISGGCGGIAILWFLCSMIIYPRLIKSEWITKHVGFTRFWSIQVVAPWTIAYRKQFKCWSPTYTCMYEGDTTDCGLPHGSGRWFDESDDGEILTGQWADGVPIAPFTSRTCRKGDGFAAVRIAYFVATDDGFSECASKPSNENPPKIGVASVECSVSGNFYNHRPLAKEMFNPIVFGTEGGSMHDILQQVIHLSEESEQSENKLEISVAGLQGLQVRGHAYTPPIGNADVREVDNISVDVHRSIGSVSRSFSRKSLFMPSGASTRYLRNDSVMILEDIEEENSDEFSIQDIESKGDSMADEEVEVEGFTLKNQADVSPSEDILRDKGETNRVPTNVAKLEVRNWTPTRQKEALIYFAGFKVHANAGACALGQLMAMTKLDSTVYPILYSWPAGTWKSFRSASAIAATQKNKDNFYLLIRSLSEAGVQKVHFMSHSMGTQNLLAMFENKDDDDLNSRSDVSLMFRQDPAFGVDTNSKADGKELMICKNFILMNPCFNLEAFVDRAFLSIRRVCQNITVISDRGDIALRGSKFLNGIYNKLGSKQTHLMQSNEMIKSYSKQFKYLSLGYDTDMLYFPEPQGNKDKEQEPLGIEEGENEPSYSNALVLQNMPSIVFNSDKKSIKKRWLDLDVIDTTSLDTNMQRIRHNGFNMNPIVLKDLTDLILEGNRASNRTSLLQRDDNLYTYSHAPSYVTM